MSVAHCPTQLGVWSAVSLPQRVQGSTLVHGGAGGEAFGNLAFSGYQIQAKNRSHRTYFNQFMCHRKALNHDSRELKF